MDLLLNEGALVVRHAAARAVVASVDAELSDAFAATPFSEGNFYGRRTVRFGRLLARSQTMRGFVTDPLIHGVAAAAIARWHRSCSLSFAQAIAIHPGSQVQVPHRDGEMWPVPTSDAEHLVSVMWPLTDFDASNGATMVWPRSHRAGEGDAAGLHPKQIRMEPGDALIFLGSTRHAGGANGSGAPRRGVVVGYAASWLVPAENPALAYPPEVARTFAPELAALVGYTRYPPNLNNYDCRCPSELLAVEGPGTGAVDELVPEHVAGLERFYADLAA